MNWSKGREIFKLVSIALWLIFTITFALWWLKFNLENIALLAHLEPEKFAHWERERRMIVWEGSSWIVLLALGGLALTGLVQRERWRVIRIREFFASFSHEIKTSLASLRVQAEALQDENIKSPILDRLVGDTVRLALQLENSLFLSSQDTLQLFMQPIPLDDIVGRLREQWPGLSIIIHNPCVLRGDERALRTILSNLVQNAIVHGGAKTVHFHATALDHARIELIVEDDGRGLKAAQRAKLGSLFHRPMPTSGSGLGLFICRLLVSRMKGEIQFIESESGFRTLLILEGGLL